MRGGAPGSGEVAGGMSEGLADGLRVECSEESGGRARFDERGAQAVADKVVDVACWRKRTSVLAG